MKVIVLDTGPLGLLSNPRPNAEAEACQVWFANLTGQGQTFAVPEMADYELRRELLRAGKIRGLRRLDGLYPSVNYLPLTTPAMRKAAELWASARREGRPTAANAALDGDVILAAQTIIAFGTDAVIATTNAKHLDRFVSARLWADIT